MDMAEEERHSQEDLYEKVTDQIAYASASFPEITIVAPEGFQSFISGISQVWRRKGVPGIMIHSGRYGLSIDVSVSMTVASPIHETAQRFQQAVRRLLEKGCTETVSSVNIDVVRITK